MAAGIALSGAADVDDQDVHGDVARGEAVHDGLDLRLRLVHVLAVPVAQCEVSTLSARLMLLKHLEGN